MNGATYSLILDGRPLVVLLFWVFSLLLFIFTFSLHIFGFLGTVQRWFTTYNVHNVNNYIFNTEFVTNFTYSVHDRIYTMYVDLEIQAGLFKRVRVLNPQFSSEFHISPKYTHKLSLSANKVSYNSRTPSLRLAFYHSK